MKSSYSGNGGCVDVGIHMDSVWVRDTKNPGQEPLWFSHKEWRAFLLGVAAGEFDLPDGV